MGDIGNIPQSSPGLLRRFDNVANGILNGMTFGGFDWLAGHLDAVVFGGRAEDRIAARRAETESRKAEGIEEALSEMVGAFVGAGRVARVFGGMLKLIGVLKEGSTLQHAGSWISGWIAQPLAASTFVDERKNLPTPGFFRRADSIVRGLANGITFGAADWFAGKLDALMLGGRSQRHIDAQRAETQRRHTEGGEAEIGEFAGAMIGIGKVVRGAGWLIKGLGLVKSESRTCEVAKWFADYVVTPVAASAVASGISDANANTAQLSPRQTVKPVEVKASTEVPRPYASRGRLRSETASGDMVVSINNESLSAVCSVHCAGLNSHRHLALSHLAQSVAQPAP